MSIVIIIIIISEFTGLEIRMPHFNSEHTKDGTPTIFIFVSQSLAGWF